MQPNHRNEDQLEIQAAGLGQELEAVRVGPRPLTDKEQLHVRDLAILSEAAMSFLEFPQEEDIYPFIGENLKRLVGDALVAITSFDRACDRVSVCAILGLEEHRDTLLEMLGGNSVGLSLGINEEARAGLTTRKLEQVAGGLYALCFGEIPESVCGNITELLNLGEAYAMGFSWGGELYGSASVIMRNGNKLTNKSAIETFIRQASVILQRRNAEAELRRARDGLEEKIKKRTRELEHVNSKLRLEIQERMRTEESLRESEEKYRMVVQNAIEGILVTQNLRIVFANKRASDFLRYSEEELISNPDPFEFIHPDYRKIVAENHLKRLRGEEAPGVYSFKIVNRDGETRWVDASGVRIQWKGKPAILNFFTDITERMRAEEEKKKLEAQILKIQKLESLGNLAGGVSHNFNNVLTIIQGHATLASMDIGPGHPSFERLKRIQELVMKGAKITKQLLAYAMRVEYQVDAIDLNQVVKETSNTFGETRKEIRIHQDLSEDLHGIRADRGQIEQVLMNLFINAADAMPLGGELFLKTANVIHEEMTGKYYQPKLGNYVLLKVTDTGMGMDKETMHRLFEPFYTTKGLAEGTGLGLASTYGIMKSHGGYIDVSSEEGKGTTFEIYLPASEEKPDSENLSHGEHLEKGTETILLVDDEQQVLDVGDDILKALGYTTLLARRGEEALEIYREQQDRIDLVILDMIMPGMGGGRTYDELKAIDNGVKVLLTSGYAVEGQADTILKRGCNGFIQKPFTIMGLSVKTREILDGSYNPH